jgi:hypothetical protein
MPKAFGLANSVCLADVLGALIVLGRSRTVMLVSVGASRARLCRIGMPSSPAPRTRIEVMELKLMTNRRSQIANWEEDKTHHGEHREHGDMEEEI